nr:MAG: nonstructural protein [Microvirus sp.]
MKKGFYSVWDSKSRSFCNPFSAHNDQCAIRDFAYAASDPTTDICKYPTDYTLFKIGSFDFESGALTVEETPVSLGLASSMINFDKE